MRRAFWFPSRAVAGAGLGKSRKMPEGLVGGSLRPAAEQRRQCAALPIFGQGAGLRVVLITSRETRRWVIPKGWVERGEAPYRSAAREAFEEAGLAGDTETTALGSYAYNKRLARGGLLRCEVLVYRFRVARLLRDWPERAERERRLFTPAAAAALVMEPDLARLLRSLSAA
jgi:8-oxo-dGTP pyrophosphatase MutT (NUDIX family)